MALSNLSNRDILIFIKNWINVRAGCGRGGRLIILVGGGSYMPKGIVKWFNFQKGYGFIMPDDGGDDAFVHISAVEQSGLTSLDEGQKVNYELAEGRNGKIAAQTISISE
jgi:CspA family cold shock protein